MQTNSHTDFDGVLTYEASLGLTPLKKPPFDSDNFYPADGCGCGCGGTCSENHSGALGGLIPSRAELKKIRERRQNRKDIRADSMAKKRVATSNAKLSQAEAQKAAATSLGQDSASDVALANAIASSAPKSQSGLSKGAKIGIAVGAVVVLSAIGFLIYKKMKK